MNKVVKILFMAMLVSGILYIAGCDGGRSVHWESNVENTDFIAEDDFLFPIEVADQTFLRLEAVNGSISITGRADFDSVIIAGTKRVRSESVEDAEEHLALLDVSVHDMAHEINIRTIQPDESHGRNYEVIYNIIVPDDFVISTSSVNGTVVVDSISNGITVSNVNGHIGLDNITGSALVSLVNGQISGNMTLPSAGTLTMSTVNGGIGLSIPQSTSSEFTASVVNGNITISGLNLQNEIITNSSVSGILGDGDGHIALSTVNGNIAVGGF